MLTKELAEKIVRETMTRLQRNINVIDESGTIIASGDSTRIGMKHAAAAEAIRTNRTVIVNEQNAVRWRGVQFGINLPIVYDHKVVGAIGVSGHQEEVEPFGELVKMATELMISENQQKLQEEWRQRIIDEVINNLIEARELDINRTNQLLHILRLTMTSPFQVTILSLPDPVERVGAEDGWLQMCQTVFSPKEALIGYLRPGKIIIVSNGLIHEKLDRKLLYLSQKIKEIIAINRPYIYCSTPVKTIGELHIGYLEANLALKLGTTLSDSIVYFKHVEALAYSYELPKEHQDRLVEKLKPHWNEKVQKTLKCLFENNLNIAQAASKLGIHRNTILYRIEQVKIMTDYNPLNFHDAMILQFMVWLYEWGKNSSKAE